MKLIVTIIIWVTTTSPCGENDACMETRLDTTIMNTSDKILDLEYWNNKHNIYQIKVDTIL